MTTIETQLKYSNTPEYEVPPTAFCPGCAYSLALRYFLKAVGPRVIFIHLPGCWNAGRIEDTGEPIDQVMSPLGNSASLGAGIAAALAAQGDTETLVVPWAGDGATCDIGMGALSGAAERNDNLLYVCIDNEAYQNTGNHRSSASPFMSTTYTSPPGAAKLEFKKDIDLIMAAHRIPYQATAVVAFPEDFMRKAKKAASIKGFRFLHVLSVCPTGWGFPADKTLEMARLLVDTKVFPLFEVENGVRYTINYQPKGLSVSNYLDTQKRFRSMSAEDKVTFEMDIEERWRKLQHLAGYQID